MTTALKSGANRAGNTRPSWGDQFHRVLQERPNMLSSPALDIKDMPSLQYINPNPKRYSRACFEQTQPPELTIQTLMRLSKCCRRHGWGSSSV